MRRISQISVVTALLAAALGAGWLVSVSGAGNTAAPAVEPTVTPAPVHTFYLPLVAHLMGASRGPITVTQAFAASSWQAESAGLDYAAVAQGAAYLVTYDQGVPAVGQSATAGDRTYRANQAYLYFDTAAIPARATVLAATLTAANCWRVAGDPFMVEFYRTAAPRPPTPADWLNYGGPLVGALPAADCGAWSTPVTATVTLDPASIAPGGLTAYALTSDRLRLAQAPAWGATERLVFDGYAADVLVVQYVLPPE